jgi:pimeloyl-ACP methyl ester carboxylesterase
VLRHAAGAATGAGLLPAQPVDAVVSVSAPSRWYIRDTVPMRRVHWLCETAAGRLAAATLLHTRLGGRWLDVPESPVEVMHRIPPTPLLLVHGDRDAYFPVEHATALAAAAGTGAELWLVPGFGHAEAATTPALLDRIAAWTLHRLDCPPMGGTGTPSQRRSELPS